MKHVDYSNLKNPSFGGGSGGDSTFQNDIVVQLTGGKTLGKYTNGQTIHSTGLSAEAVITDIATEYLPPSLNGLTSAIIKTYEVGELVSSGLQAVNYSVNNSVNIKAQPPGVGVASSTIAGATFVNPFTLLAVGNFNITIPIGFTRLLPANETITLTGTNTLNANFSTSAVLAFRQRVFWGQSSSTALTAAGIQALTNNQLQSGFAGTYSFGAGGYKWFVYPVSMGLASSFTDTSNGFPVAMNGAPLIISKTNAYGVTENYYAHRTLNVLGGTINILIN